MQQRRDGAHRGTASLLLLPGGASSNRPCVAPAPPWSHAVRFAGAKNALQQVMAATRAATARGQQDLASPLGIGERPGRRHRPTSGPRGDRNSRPSTL
ncbi:unnamed protein product [Arctogadus glacialis]